MSTNKTSHLERTAAEPRARELFETKLSRIDQVNERVRLLRLDLAPAGAEFLPGQWLDTYVPDIPKAGGFTITSAPSAARSSSKPYLELAVQESPANPPAAWLWRPTEEILGSTLKVRIGGSFTFPPVGLDLVNVKRVAFVAGGVGVNPFMSMLSSIGEGKIEGLGNIDVRFVYASKVPSEGVEKMLFLDRITRLYSEGKINGSVQVFATGARDEDLTDSGTRDINGVKVEVHGRRLSSEDVRTVVGETDKTVVYVCGPQTMTDELVTFLTSKEGLGMDSERVLKEKWW